MKNLTKWFLIILLITTFLASTAFGLTYGQANYRKHIRVVLSARGNDPIYNFIGEVESKISGEKGTGTAYFVDSGVTTEGNGTSWSTAKDTLQEGIDLCTDNRGDIVYVAQDHAEDITAASALDLDCPGMTIIGFGSGEHQPTISLITNAGAEMTISEADITIYNIRILGAYSGGVTAGIVITADGDGARIINCDFRETSSSMEQLIMISITAAADELYIVGNRFITSTGDDTSAIVLAGASDKTVIAANYFYGEWTDYVIKASGATSVEMLIQDNIINNLDATAGKLMTFTAASTGSLINNKCYGNGASFALVGDAMFVDPDNVFMNTENAEVRNYETMFGAFSGTSGAGQGNSIYADMVLAQSDLDDILQDFLDYELDKLASADDSTGATAYPDSVVQDSILAYIMGDDTNPVVTTYDNTTDSLEALGIKTADILTDTGTTLPSTLSGINTSIASIDATGLAGTCEVNAGGTTFATCAALGGFGDDYFNTGWSLLVTLNFDSAGGDPEGNIIDIIDYTSGTGLFELNVAADAAITTGDGIWIFRQHELNLDDPAMLGSSGDILYVDSGTSGDGSGLIMENAYATLTLALDGATESTDVIIVASAHTETISAAYAINDAGLLIKGLGEGMLRPTFTLNSSTANANLDVSVANVTFENLIFTTDLADMASCFDVAGGGDGLTIKDCLFTSSGTGTEFLTSIDLASGADDVTVENCTFLQLGTDADRAIGAIDTGLDNLRVINCVMYGDYDNGCVYSDQDITNSFISGNVFHQEASGIAAFDVGNAATGTLVNNRMYMDDYGTNGATMLDPGAMICINNWGTDAADQQAIRIPISAATEDVTAVADGSNLERLEYLQEKSDDILASLGIDSAQAANVFYVDSSAGGSASGTNWTDAEITLKAAIDDATDNTGAYIFIAANHAETIAASVGIDCPGVTIWGLGVNESRPKLTFSAGGSVLAHSVADVKWKNIIFISGTADTTVGFTLDAGSDGAIFEDCVWINTTTIEFVSCVTATAAADDVRFTRCRFINDTADGGGAGAITNIAVVCDNWIIEDCYFFGAWTAAAIVSDDAETNWIVRNNTVQNTSTGIHAIEIDAAVSGAAYGNKCYADTWGTITDFAGMKCYDNYETSEVDEAGYLRPARPQKIDSVHGTGRIIHVDSGAAASGGGGTWATAFQTIDAAMDDTVADRGDTIYVAQGHVEVEASGADIFTMDVEGVSIIGISNGTPSGVVAAGAVTGTDSQMPLFILDHVDATITISAANCRLQGIRVESDIADMKIGLTMTNASDGSVVEGCVFSDGGATEELLIGASVAADADAVKLLNNRFSTVATGGCTHAVLLAGGCDNGVIKGNRIYGTYATGCLVASAAQSLNLTIEDNIFVTTAVIAAVTLKADSTGIYADNYAGSATTILLTVINDDAMWCFGNFATGAPGANAVTDPADDSD